MASSRVPLPVVFAFALGACADTYQPMIDTKGVDQARYQADLEECRAYARQVDPAGEAIAGALVGAALGAALGAVTGSFYDSAGSAAAFGAAYGGTAGTAAGAGHGIAGQIEVINACLRGRGYSVLRGP